MSHGHDHAHGHSHVGDRGLRDGSNQQRVLWALVLTGIFMLAEVAGGLISGSLALLADAGHMLTDAASLGLAWFAFRAARRSPDELRTYGYQRFQVLAAFVNGALLLAIVAAILVEAVHRLMSPVAVTGGTMLAVAVLGLLVNIAAFVVLHGGDRANLNVRGALLHVVGDLLGSAGVIVAAGVILATGWTPIDPLISIVVAALVMRSAWYLIKQSGHILLEGKPEHIDIAEVRQALRNDVVGLVDVHHVHAWSLNEERPLLTLHANIREGADPQGVLDAIKRLLHDRFGIDHSTVQLEPEEGCAEHRMTVADRKRHAS